MVAKPLCPLYKYIIKPLDRAYYPELRYWFTSGTPTYLIEMLKKFQVMPSEIGSCEADKSEFDVALGNMNSILPILYQSGYITIKGYDPETELFTLDIPNMEVKKAWMWLEDIYAFRKERRQL